MTTLLGGLVCSGGTVMSPCGVLSMDGVAMTTWLGSRSPTTLDATCTRWEVSP